MIPTYRDFVDFYNAMKYYFGLAPRRPKSAIFSYVEKAEYWALLWGTVVMVLTGLILWFPESIPSTWPLWLIEVSRTFHFFEAVLAFSAILVWHLFHTIMHPSEYPMDTSWVTGKLTEHEARHRFTEEAVRQQVPPPPDHQEVEAPEIPEWQKDEEEKAEDKKGE